VTQDAFLDFYHPVDQQMIVYHMILIPPTQILVESSVKVKLQKLLNFNKTPMEIHKERRTMYLGKFVFWWRTKIKSFLYTINKQTSVPQHNLTFKP